MATINIPSTVDDPNYRYKMPRVKAKIEGRGNGIKTNIVNMGDIARALKRPSEYATKFCGCELGASSKFEVAEGKAIVNGAHTEADVQSVIDKFIERFVLCPQCRLPEIDLRVHKGRVQGVCNACGFTGDMDNAHKVATYILKNPPDGGTSTVGSSVKSKGKKTKEERRAEKAAAASAAGGVEGEHVHETGSDKSETTKEKSSSSSKKEKKEKKDKKDKKKKSKRSAEEDPGLVAANALNFDSPELDPVITRIHEFVRKAERPTPKDFFEEVRLLQVAQDFSPVIRVYVSLAGLFKEGNLTEETLRPQLVYLKSISDRSVDGEMILEAFEVYMNKLETGSTESYARICSELYNADLVDEETFLDRYGGTSGAEDEAPKVPEYQKKAAQAAAPFVRWLLQAESASSDSE